MQCVQKAWVRIVAKICHTPPPAEAPRLLPAPKPSQIWQSTDIRQATIDLGSSKSKQKRCNTATAMWDALQWHLPTLWRLVARKQICSTLQVAVPDPHELSDAQSALKLKGSADSHIQLQAREDSLLLLWQDHHEDSAKAVQMWKSREQTCRFRLWLGLRAACSCWEKPVSGIVKDTLHAQCVFAPSCMLHDQPFRLNCPGEGSSQWPSQQDRHIHDQERSK